MQVELVAMTQPVNEYVPNMGVKNPVEVSERCATVCYNSEPTKGYKIFKSCMKNGHRSVAEHISFTFHIRKVSRSLLAQLSRHRHISLSIRSQRYCEEDNFNWYCPPSLSDKTCTKESVDYEFEMAQLADEYKRLVEAGIPREDARMILPNACCTELYLTANARALIEMSHLRLCNRAQLEIRELFQHLKEEVKKVCPEVAAYMVPSCESHEIPFCEESKSCGRHKSLKVIVKE